MAHYPEPLTLVVSRKEFKCPQEKFGRLKTFWGSLGAAGHFLTLEGTFEQFVLFWVLKDTFSEMSKQR